MIRIRKIDGTSIPVDAGAFVEVCDIEGNVGLVIFRPGDSKIIHTIAAQDRDAGRYMGMFPEARFSNTITISDAALSSGNQRT